MSGSGQPTTTAWRTSACASSSCSTSAVEMFSPPRMITSFSRPTIVEPTVGVDGREVAGVEPAVGVERAGVLLPRRGSRRTLRARARAARRRRRGARPRRSRARRACARRPGRPRRCSSRSSVPRSIRTCASRPRRARRDASSTNATLTPAPPDETSRRLSTRAGAKPGACISDTKNVGGPTMNVTRSRSIRSSAVSGSHRAMKTLRNGVAPGSVIAVEQARDVRAGRGHQHAVVGAQPVHVDHERGLVRERRLGVQHALRRAARARREEHGRELLAVGPAARSTGGPVGQRVEVVDDDLGADGLGATARPPPRRVGGGAARRRRRAASTRGTAARPRRGWPTATRPRRPAPRPARAGRPRRVRRGRRARRRRARVSSSSSDGASQAPPGRRYASAAGERNVGSSTGAGPLRPGAASSRRWRASRRAARSCR